jgi:hypothetical protein
VVKYPVTSLRPEPRVGTWWSIRGLKGVDAETAYGCVDWYLYKDTALEARAPHSGRAATEHTGPKPSSHFEVRRNG